MHLHRVAYYIEIYIQVWATVTSSNRVFDFTLKEIDVLAEDRVLVKDTSKIVDELWDEKEFYYPPVVIIVRLLEKIFTTAGLASTSGHVAFSKLLQVLDTITNWLNLFIDFKKKRIFPSCSLLYEIVRDKKVKYYNSFLMNGIGTT
ncbi:hypothetical protein ACJX0J_028580 [Zea mays]